MIRRLAYSTHIVIHFKRSRNVVFAIFICFVKIVFYGLFRFKHFYKENFDTFILHRTVHGWMTSSDLESYISATSGPSNMKLNTFVHPQFSVHYWFIRHFKNIVSNFLNSFYRKMYVCPSVRSSSVSHASVLWQNVTPLQWSGAYYLPRLLLELKKKRTVLL